MGAAGSVPESSMVMVEDLKQQAPELAEIINFNALSDHNGNIAVSTIVKAVEQRRDVFLTHDWGPDGSNHKRVSLVNRALLNRGLSTWFDEEQMKGNVQMEMTNGIDNSRCILVFVTSRYMNKVGGSDANDNCQLEFQYAARRKSPALMIPVVMEPEMKNTRNWIGPVGLNLGGSLYVDNSGEDVSADQFELMIDDLYQRIIHLIGKPIKSLVDESVLSRLAVIHTDEIRPSASTKDLGKAEVPVKSASAQQLLPVPQYFPPLDAIENWCNTPAHRNDKTRKLLEVWSYFGAYDWLRQPKGFVCDADKSVRIGVGEYSDDEEGGGGTQILVIQHYDSEQPGSMAKRDSWGNAPPVWGVAFSCVEMKHLTSTVLAGLNTQGTLIHREPEGDYDPDEPWWQETHWLIENGKITGIKLSIKCSQDPVASHHLVRFKQRGKTFELIGVERVDNSPPFVNADVELPSAAPSILAPTPYLNPDRNVPPSPSSAAAAHEWLVEGAGLFVIGFERGACRACNFDDHSRDLLCQELTTPVLTLTNSSEKDVHISYVWVEFWDSQQRKWVKGECLLSEGHEGRFQPMQPFEISSHKAMKCQLEGTWSIPREGLRSYNGSPNNRRIHEAFPNPLKARWSLKETNDSVQSITFEHYNQPLDNLWSTYEEALASTDEYSEGFGPDYNMEMFLHVENPLSLDKCIILIATAKSDPDCWYVKASNSGRTIGKSFSSVGPKGLRRHAVQATRDKVQEVDLELTNCNNCTVMGLVDHNTQSIYALKGVIEVKDGNDKLVCYAENIVRLDYTKVKVQSKD